MKKEIRAAIRQGIIESQKNGYTWTITADGLKWSYLDVEFQFQLREFDEGEKFLTVHQKSGSTVHNEYFVALIIGDSKYDDAKTVEEAYKKATKATIAKANHLF